MLYKKLVTTNMCRADIDFFLDGQALFDLGVSVWTLTFGLFNHDTYCPICWDNFLAFGFFNRLSYEGSNIPNGNN